MAFDPQDFDLAYASIKNKSCIEILAVLRKETATIPEKVAAISMLRCLELSEDEKVEALLPLLSDKSGTVIQQAVFELGEIGSRRAIQPLKDLARSTLLPELRFVIYTALGKLSDMSHLKDCIQQLHSSDEDERFYAALALSESGTPEGLQELRSLFSREHNARFLILLAAELARHGSKFGEDYLLSQLNYEQDAVRKLIIASSLANLGNKEGLRAVETLVSQWAPATEMFAVAHIVQRFMNLKIDPRRDLQNQILEELRARLQR